MTKYNKTLTEKDDKMQRWKEYGQSLFCLPEGETQPIPPPEPPPELDVPSEPPPLLCEIKAAIFHSWFYSWFVRLSRP